MTHASRNTTTGLIFEENTPINEIFDFLPNNEVLMFASNAVMAKQTGMLNWRDYVRNLPGLTYIGEKNSRHPIIWNKNYIPDGAIIYNNTLYIIEKKYQQCEGTADEKLTSGDFRRTMFEKLSKYFPIQIKNVKYLFILGEWFKADKYKDPIEYVRNKNSNVEFMFYDEKPPRNFFGVE